MTMSSKIAERRLSRQACIYIRQSTMGQVRFNQESTERQYNLMTKACSLGWRPDQVRILDRDLGQSGAAMTNREDFKVLVSDVASDQTFTSRKQLQLRRTDSLHPSGAPRYAFERAGIVFQSNAMRRQQKPSSRTKRHRNSPTTSNGRGSTKL